MSLKERIINETNKLLAHMGPSAMTMDTVARNCGISKRTLYEHFGDKQTLLKNCILEVQKEHRKEYEKIFASSQNCFEALFKVFVNARKFLNASNVLVAKEIKRLYPEVYNEFQNQESRFIDDLSQVLNESQRQGLVIKQIDTRIAAFLFVYTIKTVRQSDKIAEMGFSRVRVFEGAFMNFLRGVATIKGIDMIESFLKEQQGIMHMTEENVF